MTTICQRGANSKFRFAPSPNGRLHLGHAYSALLNHDMAQASGGAFLLRIENIDQNRCTAAFEQSIFNDLNWLGLSWSEPIRRQSEHFKLYGDALAKLIARGLAYPSTMTRSEIKVAVTALEAEGQVWPRDPDGAPLYPGGEREANSAERERLTTIGKPYAWRLDMQRALAEVGKHLSWREIGTEPEQTIDTDPAAWGDVILSRSDAPSSYHLSVVVDDALQGVTHAVRGMDLFHATSIHRLLQELLQLPTPTYLHHKLILDDKGRKLSKSIQSTGLSELRASGATPLDIRCLVGL